MTVSPLTQAFALTVFCAFSAFGQNITGRFVGTVVDPNGAAIPGAQIMVVNTDTGAKVTAITDQSGTYTAPNLFAGTYDVEARKEGFQPVTAKRLGLPAAETVRQDFSLAVGGVQQSVSVTAQTPLIRTDSPTIGSTLQSEQLSNLPLATRSIDALVALAPGAATSGSNPRISGSSYWGGNYFTLNGVAANDMGNGGAAFTSGVPNLNLANMPAPDSLQEFKVESGNQNAEYKGVATITMVTRQGSNAIHGGAYEYVQNREFNANQFLLNAAGQPRPDYKLNQFGADLGSAFVKNKVFFYGAYRGVRQRTSAAQSLTFPSMAMRQGDFSALCAGFNSGLCTSGTQLYNPFTGAPLLNNQIPSTLITSQATTLLQYLPAPTDPNSKGIPNGGPNYFAAVTNKIGVNGVDYRMDWQLAPKDLVYGVFHWSKGSPWHLANASYPKTYGSNPDYGYTDYNVSATHTHFFSPAMINDLRAAWVVHASVRTGQNTDLKPWSLFTQLPVSDNGGLPTMNIGGYTGMFYDYGKGYPFPEYDIEVADNFMKVQGRHTFKFGANETGYKNYIQQGGPALSASLGNPLGTLSFNGAWTSGNGFPNLAGSQGNAFADFLLGTAVSSNFAGPLTEIVTYSRNWEFYAQDTFQATSRLTLNYGVRYQYQEPWRIRDGRVSYLDLKNNKLAIPQNSDTLTTPALAIPSLMTAYPYETTKQAGWPKSYYVGDKNNFGPRFGFAYRPLAGNRTVVRGAWGVYYNFIPGFIGAHENIFNPPWRTGASFSTLLPGRPTAAFFPDLTFSNPFPTSNQNGPASNPLIYMADRNLLNTIMQQWNLTIEHQFAETWAGRVSYVGAQTHHALYYAGDINKPNVQQPNVPLQRQRPYQPWSQINRTHTDGKVNFSQIQLELNKRVPKGLLIQANYSFTRSLDNVPLVGGVQNPHNQNADYGNTDQTPRHVLALNYMYELPVGRGKKMNLTSRALDAAIGGWSISGITIYETGQPLSVTFTVPSNYIGWWGGRPDAVAGADLYARQQSGHDIVKGVQWFNPDAFAPPQPWVYGNSARNVLFGPGFWNWDIGAQKTFTVGSGQRVQLRFDGLNAFNHFNLGTPNATIADTRDGGLPNPNAGKILSGSGNRILQLGLRYTF